MLILGLTGQCGSGKSTLAEKLVSEGCVHIDCDKLAREAVAKGTECLDELVAAFGEQILLPNGELDRKKLASIAFSDKEKLALLNGITHKHIKILLKEYIAKAKESGAVGCVVDAPTLFEAGVDSLCGVTAAVISDFDTRVERIMKRDGISRDDALLRCNAQHDNSYYESKCDYVIKNDSDKAAFSEAIASFCFELKEHIKTNRKEFMS